MNNFYALQKERQDELLERAMQSFSLNGYKKTSTNDLAKTMGISKSMVFYLFGTKKGLYLECINYYILTVSDRVLEKIDLSETDFFNRMIDISRVKMFHLKQHPYSLAFMEKVYAENDSEVEGDIKKLLTLDNVKFDIRPYLDGVQTEKFRHPPDLVMLIKLISCYARNCILAYPKNMQVDYEKVFDSTKECIEFLRKHFYK